MYTTNKQEINTAHHEARLIPINNIQIDSIIIPQSTQQIRLSAFFGFDIFLIHNNLYKTTGKINAKYPQ